MPKPIKRIADPKIITDLRDLVVSNAEKFRDTPLYHYKENKEIKTFSHKDQLEQMNALGTAFAKLGLMGQRSHKNPLRILCFVYFYAIIIAQNQKEVTYGNKGYNFRAQKKAGALTKGACRKSFRNKTGCVALGDGQYYSKYRNA